MAEASLFPDLPEAGEARAAVPTRREEARVVRPVRNQIQFLMQNLDTALAEEHQARVIWAFVERLDLSAC